MKSVLVAAIVLMNGFSSAAAFECRPADEADLKTVRELMKTVLLDNESARFHDVCVHQIHSQDGEPYTKYCGLVNAKNRYGAYTGFQPFHAVKETESGGLMQSEKDRPGVPSLGYCLGCMFPGEPIEKCFQIRLEAISNSGK